MSNLIAVTRDSQAKAETGLAEMLLVWLSLVAAKLQESMTKTPDVITEAIKNPKHPFRQVDDRPAKPQKHRYERRKVREFMRGVDWSSEAKTPA